MKWKYHVDIGSFDKIDWFFYVCMWCSSKLAKARNKTMTRISETGTSGKGIAEEKNPCPWTACIIHERKISLKSFNHLHPFLAIHFYQCWISMKSIWKAEIHFIVAQIEYKLMRCLTKFSISLLIIIIIIILQMQFQTLNFLCFFSTTFQHWVEQMKFRIQISWQNEKKNTKK